MDKKRRWTQKRREAMKERSSNRANFVATFIKANSKRGVKIEHSISLLAKKILFVSERVLWDDLKKARTSE